MAVLWFVKQLLMMKHILPIIFFFFCLTACEKKNGNTDVKSPSVCSLSGYAQKGQFVKGSQITAFVLDSDLIATGESFPANVSDDKGSFSISGKSAAQFLDIRVNGYYFNELTGNISGNQLWLEALVEFTENNANLNLLTTVIKPRVKRLIAEGQSFTESNKQAQQELLASFDITDDTSNFYDMDITKGSESDAVLLAFTCMVQNGRDAVGVSALVQEIASDLEDDGRLSAECRQKVVSSKDDIDIIRVIRNLDKFYAEKNMPDADIPRFYGYLNRELNKDFVIYGGLAYPVLPGSSGVYETHILSQVPFYVEVDCDWITVSTPEHVAGPYYTMNSSVEQNRTETERIGHIIYKDKHGNILYSEEIRCSVYEPPMLDLCLDFSECNTKTTLSYSDPFYPKVGDKALVLRKEYMIENVCGQCAYVNVPFFEFYDVLYPAESIDEWMLDDGVSYPVKLYPVEVSANDFIGLYFGYLKKSTSVYDQVVKMANQTATICLDLSAIAQRYPSLSYAVITGNDGRTFLSGRVIYKGKNSNGSLSLDAIPSGNVSNKVKITNLSADKENYVAIPAQTLYNGLTVQLFDASDTNLLTNNISEEIILQQGVCITLRM